MPLKPINQQLKSKLAYHALTVQHISHSNMRTPPSFLWVLCLYIFQSQLEVSCMSSHNEELGYNKTVCLWITIYIYIYIYDKHK